MGIEVSGEISGELDMEKQIAELRKLDGMTLEAGLFDGQTQKEAIWNEYGTSRGIPARPFLRNTMYENENRFSAYIAPFVAGILDGGTADEVAAKLGPFMAMAIRRTIAAGGFVPNAQSTVRHKGHSKPLIDTGAMYGAIDWRKD